MKGTKEIWKDIPGFEGFYQASNLGRIRSVGRRVKTYKKNGRWSPDKDISLKNIGGYLGCCLYKLGSKYGFRAHRLVAMTFIPNPQNKPCVNHKNGIKNDNRVENLEWVTDHENKIHAMENGLLVRGTAVHTCKLSESDVVIIRAMLASGKNSFVVADKFGTTAGNIRMIKANKTWKHLL